MNWTASINAIGVALTVSVGAVTLLAIAAGLVRSMGERIERLRRRPPAVALGAAFERPAGAAQSEEAGRAID